MSARGSRLIGATLRCYPAAWRRRRGDEAAELAALLLRDGVPAAAIAWSYLTGAVREWLVPRPGRSPSRAAAVLLTAICLLGLSAALIAETVPANAAGTSQHPARPVPATARPVHRITVCLPASRSGLSMQGTAHVQSC